MLENIFIIRKFVLKCLGMKCYDVCNLISNASTKIDAIN